MRVKSKSTKIKSLLNIGALPLPLGGVSVHLQRLLYELENSKVNKSLAFFDYKKEPFFYGCKKFLKADIIHIHFSNKYIRLLMVLMGRILAKKVIITFHGKYSFQDFLHSLSLRFANFSFVLNEYTFKAGLDKINDDSKIKLISAFIPPRSTEGKLSKKAKNQIDNFICKYSLVACTNAHNYVLDKNGKDLYGIDFLLDFFSENSNLGLIICDPSGNIIKMYKQFSMLNNVLFITQPEPFIEVIKKANIFIRATTTDGDSLSVKEALYYKTKVIASDCVDRPKGCILYRLSDKESFKRQVFDSEFRESDFIENGASQIIELYNQL